jgi:hypothetical protein
MFYLVVGDKQILPNDNSFTYFTECLASVLPLAPLYIYGMPSTGKKSVLSLCLEALNKRKIEIDCFLCPNER